MSVLLGTLISSVPWTMLALMDKASAKATAGYGKPV